MRKYIISVSLFLSFCFFVNAQSWDDDMIVARQIVDSLKKELKTAKGEKRIDCLNLLSETYDWIWDDNIKHLDSACMYADQAYDLAKKSTYKRGLGYATLLKAQCFAGRVDENRNNNNAETNYTQAEKWAQQAIQIGEEIKDCRLAGDVYNMLKWMERWKGDPAKFKTYVEKAIFYYEKPVTNKLSGLLNISKCDGCQGNERLLGGLYQLMAEIVFSEKKSVEAAKEYIDKSIYYRRMTGSESSLTMGNFYLQIAQVYFLNYDYKSSEQAYIKAKDAFHEAGQIEEELGALNEMNKVYEARSDFENGIATFKISIRLIENYFKDKPTGSAKRRSAGQAFFWMSRLYKIAGDYEGALAVIRRGHQYYPGGNDSAAIAPWLSEIGDTHRLMGNYDSAMYYLKGFQNSDNNPNSFGKTSLGYLYLDMKEYSKAQSLIFPYYQNLKTINRITNPIVNSLNILGNTSLGEKKYEQALQYAKEAQTYLKQMGVRVLTIDNYKLLSDIYDKMNRPDSAFAYLKQYTRLKDSLINKQFYFRLNSLKSESEEQRKTSLIQLLQKDNQLKQQLLLKESLLQQKKDDQLTLLDKDNEVKEQQLLIKEQGLKEQGLIREKNQSRLDLLSNENKFKDQRIRQQATIRNALLAGLLLLILLGVFVFRSLSWKRRNEKLAIEKKQAELQQKVTELEMQALRAQMNPHFIFNCLSSINKFVLKNDTDIASDYLTRFSRLIRLVLTNSQLSLIPLSDEIEMLRLYLDMERLRFSDSFDYNIIYANTIEPETIYIPPMLLQPFCENAIWHGLMHKEGQGKLEIMMSIRDDQLQCIITDNGIGKEKAAELKTRSGAKQKSFGLKITTERLALFNNERTVHSFYRAEDVLDPDGKVAGTRVILNMKLKNTADQPVKESI